MDTLKIQNEIIRKVLDLKDEDLLDYLHKILNKDVEKSYTPTKEELLLLNESKTDYENGNTVSNENVFLKIDKWLES